MRWFVKVVRCNPSEWAAVSAIAPNAASNGRLFGAVLMEASDELQHRYLSIEALAGAHTIDAAEDAALAPPAPAPILTARAVRYLIYTGFS